MDDINIVLKRYIDNIASKRYRAPMDYPIRFPDQIRQQLRALRKTKGLTQTQLGMLLGVGQVRIAEIERDPSVVSVAQLFKLLTALDAHIVLRDSRPDDASKPDRTPKGSW